MAFLKALLVFGLVAAATSVSLADIEAEEEEEAAACTVQLLQEKVQRSVVQRKLAVSGGKEQTAESQKESSVDSHAEGRKKLSFRNAVAEFVAMTLFVFFGCGSAMSIAKEEGSAWVLQVALTFGLAITVLAYTVGHYSGAQINCAVTFGLVVYGHVGVGQGILNFIGQMLGSVLGAALLKAMYPQGKDRTGGLGTNSIAPGWSWAGALLGEFLGTFLLMYVVLETAVNRMALLNAALAPLAIGFAVFLAHSVLIPVDGCSINPTRTFGPAFVDSLTGGSAFKDMWVFWAGPLSGALVATAFYAVMT